ncbi:glycosyl transferase [Acidisarcina polymorpha]|uniref:Glycosyl transferase n=1 Tax=Acidisarcina polymorpha TaxID=2211140 RepID=A0A2Z5FXT4_9BACT|nr:glycosyltransferase [Acidisarcina polymorpha]AXC11540.1 glycosyl transferase [Acidisarcina polymorpha]
MKTPIEATPLTNRAGLVQSALPPSISVIIPTFNGARRIGQCLTALLSQAGSRDLEILVVNDGSTDDTAAVVGGYSGVRLINQANSGPAAARNRGALESRGSILLFTDDDCVPMPDWLDAMLEPFADPEVVGAKGIYRTRQTALAARFVQIEYEDKYHLMAGLPSIDFIDTYSAGFVRERFLEMTGYDTSFPVACAEDVELSYRMSARGWKMVFVPKAIVYHTHPATFWSYLKKKYKFAFWRVLAVGKNPSKGVKDSHTPQLMKLQLLFAPALMAGLLIDRVVRPRVSVSAVVIGSFLVSTLPFVGRALRKDPVIAALSPLLLAARACAQVLGVAGGLIYARRHPAAIRTDLPA